MQLATFGLVASFVHPASGQRLPIRYLAYELDDAGVSALARGLVERVGDGGWARQLPADLLASDLRPMLFARMAALAADGVTFAGAGAAAPPRAWRDRDVEWRPAGPAARRTAEPR